MIKKLKNCVSIAARWIIIHRIPIYDRRVSGEIAGHCLYTEVYVTAQKVENLKSIVSFFKKSFKTKCFCRENIMYSLQKLRGISNKNDR